MATIKRRPVSPHGLPTSESAAERRRVLAAATVVGLVDEIDIGLLAASFMQLEKEFGFAPDVLGKLLMARGLANSLSGVVWGSLADRMDRKRLMVSSMMLAGIFTMLTPQLTTLKGFFATQMSIAFFAAAAVPVTQSLVSEKVEATNRGVAFASLAMCSGFSCSAAALLAGVLSWREAYRIMGAATISLALCLLAAFPAECRPTERTLEGALATEMEQLGAIFRIPTFRALLLGGLVGCIPWNALSFMMMFLEDLGFDSSHAAVLLAVMSVGRILGCLLGGILGDYMARVSPLHGRAFVAQLSIVLGMAPLYWVLCCYSHSSRSPFSLASALFTFSLLATWCNPGVDRPLWSELATPDCRGKIIAWWTAIAQSFGSVFAGPVVGYICVGVLGYQPGAEGGRRANAESLGTAMAICTVLPWIVCFGCYSAIHATYPVCRHLWASGCGYCTEAFPDKAQLQVHIKMVHEGMDFQSVPAPLPSREECLLHKAPAAAISSGIPLSEVNRHCIPEDCWVSLNGKVYDLSEFMDRHPGGPTTILAWAGKDASKFFNDIHKGVKIEQYLRPESFLGSLGVDDNLMSESFWHTLREACVVELREELERVLSQVSGPGSKADSIQRLHQWWRFFQRRIMRIFILYLCLGRTSGAAFRCRKWPTTTSRMTGWVALNGAVYDLTEFLLHHPEQRNAILAWAGRDATPVWNKIPGRYPSANWMEFYMRPESGMGDIGDEPVVDPTIEQLRQLQDELRKLEGPSKEDIDAARSAAQGRAPGKDVPTLGEESRFPKLLEISAGRDLPFFSRAEAGTDVTKDFEVFEHSEKARVQRDRDMLVGQLVPAESADWNAASAVAPVSEVPGRDALRYMKHKAFDAVIAAVGWYLYKTLQNRKALSQFTYSRALRHLHLIMAVGIFGAIGTVQAASRAEGQNRKHLLWWHKQTGIAMLVALFVRAFFRLRSGIPPRFPGHPIVQMIETQSFRAFYALALLLPVSGIANEYFLKWAPGCEQTGKEEDDRRNERLAEKSIDTHKVLGKLLQYMLHDMLSVVVDNLRIQALLVTSHVTEARREVSRPDSQFSTARKISAIIQAQF
eukprot:s554_g6.t1